MVIKEKVRGQIRAMMVMAMVAKAMAMVTKAKVRADGGNDGIQGEREVPGVAACPLEDDWEIPDTRQDQPTAKRFQEIFRKKLGNI